LARLASLGADRVDSLTLGGRCLSETTSASWIGALA
jgi:hypothetical protein